MLSIICLFIAAAAIASTWASPAPVTRETLEEAAVNAKRLVRNSHIGTMSSVFPADSPNAGHPFAIMEYHALCFRSPALTFSLMPISLSTRNILSDPSHKATYTVSMPNDHAESAMSRARVSFIGNITVMDYDDIPYGERERLRACYRYFHPDAWWTPTKKQTEPHESFWAKFEPQDIYYVGGFGDTHYIGHIPVDMYAEAGEKPIAVDIKLLRQGYYQGGNWDI